jgi:hypothetical protein
MQWCVESYRDIMHCGFKFDRGRVKYGSRESSKKTVGGFQGPEGTAM